MPEENNIPKEETHDTEVETPEVEVVEEINEYLEELEREKAQLAQQLLRLKADYENFKRRSKNQMESLVLEANEQLLQDLLPVLDNFERALGAGEKCSTEEEPFFQGMEMVYQGLLHILGTYGLQAIVAKEQPFDPNLHDAISMEGEGEGELFVREQIQTGYLLNDKVLRHTKVLVGKNEEED